MVVVGVVEDIGMMGKFIWMLFFGWLILRWFVVVMFNDIWVGNGVCLVGMVTFFGVWFVDVIGYYNNRLFWD